MANDRVTFYIPKQQYRDTMRELEQEYQSAYNAERGEIQKAMFEVVRDNPEAVIQELHSINRGDDQ